MLNLLKIIPLYIFTDGEIHIRFEDKIQNEWMKVTRVEECGLFTYNSGAELSDSSIKNYCLAKSRSNQRLINRG